MKAIISSLLFLSLLAIGVAKAAALDQTLQPKQTLTPQEIPLGARPGVPAKGPLPDITDAKKGIIIGGAVGGDGGKFVPWGTAADLSDIAPLPGTIVQSGCAFNVTYFETNAGTADTSPLYMNKLKLDGADAAINTNRKLVASETKSVTTQPYLNLGGHGLELSLDAGGAVAESNEGNNVFTIRYTLAKCKPASTTGDCRGLPDLVPAVPVPMNGVLAVKNGGICPAVPSKLLVDCRKEGYTGGGGGCPEIPEKYKAMYSDPAFPNSFILAVPALAPGAVFSHTVPFWASLPWTPGKYAFTGKADAAGAVAESNEGNNGFTSSLTVP